MTADIPSPWLLPAIAMIETHSTLNTDGTITRRDWRDDRDSVGPFQMRPVAWADVSSHFPGRALAECATDPILARNACLAYVMRYHRKGEPWIMSACHWNGGPGKVPAAYKRKIEAIIGSGGN